MLLKLKYLFADRLSPLFYKKPNEPYLSERISSLILHFDMDAIQSAMLIDDPEFLALGYTKSMMGFLFFQPNPKKIAMIGLGGGSLAKYCLKHLPDAHFTAIEINPKVIALRDQFSIPADNENFTVICANGADYVRNRSEKVDVLLIDGFKLNGQPESLSNAVFYKNCYARLNPGGVMVANLLEDDNNFTNYISRIQKCFKNKVLVIDAESRGNRIAFAYKGNHFPPSIESIQELVSRLQPNHKLPLYKISKKITISIEKSLILSCD